ncbi:MAG: uroporphyrinogen-III synthase, partial [Bacteroidetes bacterium]|nr:uroporphyrinogen-III synthase [Bacteroidota bacterium]
SIKAHGGTVEEVVVYNTLPNDSIDGQLKGEVKSGKFDAIVFFQPVTDKKLPERVREFGT